MRDVWHLSQIDWIEALPETERARLRAAAEVEDFAPGSIVFAPTPRPECVYLLESGRIRIFRRDPDGSETTFGYVLPGEVFGELPGFGDYPRESYAEAAEPSRVWRIPVPLFRELVAVHSQITVEITRQIGDRLKRIENRVENLVFRDARSRVAAMLLELAERFGHRHDGRIRLDLALTQAEFATLVGATRQTVNECLGELSRLGLVRREGRSLELLDRAGLERMARPADPAAGGPGAGR